jgi:CBS domain-containing protein
MTSKDASASQTLKIHRSTVLGPERPLVTLTVHCPVDDRAVPARRCEECPRCVTFPRNPARTDATIACRVGGAPSRDASDLRLRMCAPGRSGRSRDDLGERAARAPIHQVMESVYSVTVRAPLSQITALFESPSIATVPVTSEDGAPVGVISRADLVRERWELTRPDLEAGDIMTPLTNTLPDVASLSHAIALMALEGIHAVPIVDADGIVVGMVTAIGAMRWMAERMGYLLPAGAK